MFHGIVFATLSRPHLVVGLHSGNDRINAQIELHDLGVCRLAMAFKVLHLRRTQKRRYAV